MKRIFAIIGILLLISGCGAAARQSEFWQHDRVYKNWDHLEFSWHGYKNPSQEDGRKSTEQGWWGIEVPAQRIK